MRQTSFRTAVVIGLISVTVVSATSCAAHCAEEYRFDRMWPTLQQPWYFKSPLGVAVNQEGYVFVAEVGQHRVQKFSADGILIQRWGTQGSEPGEFYRPRAVAVDDSFVYVVDSGNSRVQKFTHEGTHVSQWGSYGSAEGQFASPGGIAISLDGDLYVVDTYNSRIQSFTSTGQLISSWGTQGSGDGQFFWPEGIALDANGNLYVTDTLNYRVQKFTAAGGFISAWGTQGSGAGQFNFDYPSGIAVDSGGYVYVFDAGNQRMQKFSTDGQFITQWGSVGAGEGEFGYYGGAIAIDRSGQLCVTDTGNYRIQRFTAEGRFVAKWGSEGVGAGEFRAPLGIALHQQNIAYVADGNNHRIQTFSAEGTHLSSWGSQGGGDGEFLIPWGIAFDQHGYCYVTDNHNNRVQKFTSDGRFVTKWGSEGWGHEGSGEGEFYWPQGICVDQNGAVYVVDTYNHRIQKFTDEGQFLLTWGGQGSDNGEFSYPSGIGTDAAGNVYVADSGNNRIQKFTGFGQYLGQWGSFGAEDGQFDGPSDIKIDAQGFVYVTDSYNHRVQKFDPHGQFLSMWGNIGSEPGSFNLPFALALDTTGRFLISELGNNRIQAFKLVSQSTNNKAIIVAGGGPYQGNQLWDATQMCANFAYRTLTYQGLTKDSIYYLSSDLDLDIDSNGALDDVDADATVSNLQQAVSTWAAGADDVIVYLTDHGGDGSFRMSDIETLSASSFDAWLDRLQQTITGKLTVIYDACESGSFLSTISPPSGSRRIVITSTSPDESAYFVTQGSISFSNYFWTHVFNGLSVYDAFDLANQAIGQTSGFQHPLLDDNGNGTGNEAADGALARVTYLGNGTLIQGDAPVIGAVSPSQNLTGSTTAALYAAPVTDADGIARVWAVIRPPNYTQADPDNPVQELPSLELMPAGSDRYEGAYSGFTSAGTYQVAVYCRDRIGNTSVPRLTSVSVANPLTRKAIIVAGGTTRDTLWPAVRNNAVLAYETLSYQGYANDTIYFLCPATISAGVDGLPTISNLRYAITAWAAQNAQDVVLYLVGEGGDQSLRLNSSEVLSAIVLDPWLDTLQRSIPGKVTVIYDACQAGSFLPVLSPPSGHERILLASTGSAAPAYFLSGGDICFSTYFWKQVLNGADVREAFLHSKQALSFSCQEQTPIIDDNGNGIGNEREDGRLSMNYTIGTGIMLAGDDPTIGTVAGNQTLSGNPSATLWAEGVTTTGTISRVWAVITPPDFGATGASDPITDLPTVELREVATGRYEGMHHGFLHAGDYAVAIYALDEQGNVSLPKTTTVTQQTSAGTVSLYFPCLRSGSGWESELGIINASADHTLSAHLRGFSASGQELGSLPLTLPPRGRRELTAGSLFPTTIAYAILTSDSDAVRGYAKLSQERLCRVALPATMRVNNSDLYIPHLASSPEWTTTIALLNTTPSAKTLTLEGNNGQSAPVTLGAMEQRAFGIRELFPTPAQPDMQAAVVRNSQGVMGAALFSGGNQLGGLLLSDEKLMTIYYPHVASNAQWWTGIVAYNPAPTTCILAILPYREDGAPLAAQQVAIPGGQKYIGTATALNLPAESVWLQIRGTNATSGFELCGTTEASQLAAYPGIGISSREAILAKVEQDGWTQIGLVNLEPTPATITLTAYDESGMALAVATVGVNAKAKLLGFVENIFTEDITGATHITYSATKEVVGFQLNGSNDGTMLDALPGL